MADLQMAYYLALLKADSSGCLTKRSTHSHTRQAKVYTQ